MSISPRSFDSREGLSAPAEDLIKKAETAGAVNSVNRESPPQQRLYRRVRLEHCELPGKHGYVLFEIES
jgi:hypothetical protein